jgi:DDE superfamily endonuclease
MTNRKIEYWVIPPEADGEFVAHMEEVLETYARPYDPMRPVLCMDEQPVQLLKETRVPIPATRQHPQRVDYEYERAGTANIFMFAEPLAGWREVAVRETKTKVDWAVEMALLMEGRYAERVTVVCDNLNTHTKGAFYESFPPARARQLVRRIEFCYTPAIPVQLTVTCPDPPLLTVTLSLVPTRAESGGRVRGGPSPNAPIGDQFGLFTPHPEPDAGSAQGVPQPNNSPRPAAPDYDVS